MLRNNHPPRENGYALLIIMMMLAILLIMLTEALPSVYTEAQREKEKELIFRGTQYGRAIYLFHQQFHRYPTSVKELLETNDMRFLRQAYPDPMSRDGKWRFIHATANGIIMDSKTITPPGMTNPQGTSPGAGNPPGQSQGNPPSPLGAFSNSQNLKGAYIVGVAPISTQQSIMVYNHHTHYDKWEFLGIPGVPGSVIPAVIIPAGLIPSAPGQPGAAPSPQGLPGGPQISATPPGAGSGPP
jgi:type II secretory pathway pseudopilin PulG